MIARAMLLVLAAQPVGGWAADMPRLAGVVVAPAGRAALFDTGAGGLTRAEPGDEVDGYRVGAIEPGSVRLERGEQVITLHPGRTRAPRSPADGGGVTFGLVLRPQPPVDD